ncbi:glycosyltransferase [Acidobacteriota bacterium]
MIKLVIIIPAFNEQDTIGSVIENIPKNIHGIDDIEVIVMDDGSTDKTAEIAREKGAVVFSHPNNQGLGITFRGGIERALKADADIIVNIDADGQFNSRDIPQLVAPVLDGRAEFVTASRFIEKDRDLQMPRLKYLGNKLMSRIISRIIRQKFYDVSCGYRAYSREAAMKLNLFGLFTYTQETFIDLAYKGIPIIEVPIKVRGEREYGQSKVASNLFKYGFHTLKIIFMAIRDYHPFRLSMYISSLFFLLGLGAGIFFLIHYFNTGAFKPYTWVGFLSAASFGTSLFMMFVGIFLEMISRVRINQERLLYYARSRYFIEDKDPGREDRNGDE